MTQKTRPVAWALLAFATAFTMNAQAATEYSLKFTFDGIAANNDTMKKYILGCLPNKTWIETFPGQPTDKWKITVPVVGGHEWNTKQVKDRLMSTGCDSVRPDTVSKVSVNKI